MYDTLCSDKEEQLYMRCKSFKQLSAVLRVFNMKVDNGQTHKSFTELLELLKDMLLEGNMLLSCNYEANKILILMGMHYIKIHVCHNDHILYMNEYEKLNQCPECMESCNTQISVYFIFNEFKCFILFIWVLYYFSCSI